MFSLDVQRGAPVIRGIEPFDNKSLWLPAAFLCLLAIPFDWIGVFAPAIWLALVAIENSTGWKKAASFLLAGLLMLVVNSGVIPGNEAITLLQPYIEEGSKEISVYIRPAKAVIALTLVLFMLMRPQPIRRADLGTMFIAIAAPIALGFIFLGAAFVLNATIAAALLVNLVVVCIAEEGFFRWILQRGLTQGLASKLPYARLIVAIVVAVLFTVMHIGWVPSPTLLALVGVASLSYALMWALRQSFWACVLTHWGVNVLHMTLLVYPA